MGWEVGETGGIIPGRLSPIQPIVFFVSAASTWEIAIRRQLGKLRVDGSALEALRMNGFIDLSVAAEDAELAGVLDWAHADPFDRLILGRAQRHAMSLITADAAVREFIAVAQIAATYSVGREGRRCRQTR